MNKEHTFSDQIFDILSTIVVVAISFGIGYGLGQSRWAPLQLNGFAGNTPIESREAFVPFWEVWALVNSEYFDQPLDPNILVEGAINGMLETLDDRNTAYLSPDEQDNAISTMQGEFEGIGAEVEGVDGQLIIVSPFEGSPAAQAGLRPRDIVRKADGRSLDGLDVSEAVEFIRGPAGTDVVLEIERNGELFEVTITRDTIDLPSVSGELLERAEESFAYVRINRFAEKTSSELEALLIEQIEADPDGLIIDLRRNPGGSLTTVVNVADQFLPESNILIERFGNGDEKTFDATDDGLAEEIELVVLIDEGSASASEVLAGAIRDNGRGILIGQTTFGKGTVQNWSTLSNGGGVRITVARWLTPEETWVHESGLDPDILVEIPEDFDFTSDTDPQLEAAIEYLIDN
ncbi:MAG: S41 family peptidase [Chloroflexota bacterium]